MFGEVWYDGLAVAGGQDAGLVWVDEEAEGASELVELVDVEEDVFVGERGKEVVDVAFLDGFAAMVVVRRSRLWRPVLRRVLS